MDLSAYLHRLLAPLQPGDEIVEGARWTGVSSELGLLLRFDLEGEPLGVSVAPVEHTPRFAARSDRLAFGYRTEGGRRHVDPRRAKEVCEAVAHVARRNEAAVLDDVTRLTAARAQQPAQRIRHVHTHGILEPAGLGGEHFYTLSPYVGCLVGCRFCYAQSKLSTVRRLVGLPETPWGSYVDVRVNAPELLRAELEAREPLPIKFCPIVSDPYQAVERREQITRRCLETIRDASRPWPTLLLTRSELVLRDAGLLAALPRCFVGISLPTVDDEVRRHFEPRAASVEQRLDVLRELKRRGIPTFAVVQPLLPGSLEELAARLAETTDSVSIDVLRGEEGAGADFDDARFAQSREPEWQQSRAQDLAAMLAQHGVRVWSGELPPELGAGAPALARADH